MKQIPLLLALAAAGVGADVHAQNYNPGLDAYACEGSLATGSSSTACGGFAEATGPGATANGAQARATAQATTALGNYANATAAGATATGAEADATGVNSTATGSASSASGANATATGSQASAGGAGATATGAASNASGDLSVATGLGAQASARASAAVGNNARATADSCTALGAATVCDEAQTVSIGNSAVKRRLTNVDNGRNDTDATNVRQVRPLANALGGGSTYNNLGQYIPPSYVFRSGATYNNVGSALDDLDGRVHNLENGEGGQGPAGQDGASAYEVALRNGFSGSEQEWLDSLRGAQGPAGPNGMGGSDVVAGDNIDVQDNADGTQTVSLADNISLSEQGSLEVGATTVNADGVSIEGGPSLTRQGIDAGNQRITGVADGRIAQGSLDAVNGGQLWELENRFNDRWTEIDRRFERTDKRLNGLGAQMGAMSMMAATPGEGGITVGLGYSGGQGALAVGWSRRITERVGLSAGVAFGGGNKPVLGMGLRIGGR